MVEEKAVGAGVDCVSGCQYRWKQVNEQVWVQVWAGPCSSAEAAGCHSEEWGPQKRAHSPLWTPFPCRGASLSVPGLWGEPMEQACWALQTSCTETLGAVLWGGAAPGVPTHTASPGDGASVGQCWGYISFTRKGGSVHI